MSEYLNTDKALCCPSSLLMTDSSKPDKRACSLSQHTHQGTSVFTCRGDSHIAILSGCKVPLRGDKSPLPCQRVLALHPQTLAQQNLHLGHFLFLLSPHFSFPSSLTPLIHSFSRPAVSPPAFKIKVSHQSRWITHTYTESHTQLINEVKWNQALIECLLEKLCFVRKHCTPFQPISISACCLF